MHFKFVLSTAGLQKCKSAKKYLTKEQQNPNFCVVLVTVLLHFFYFLYNYIQKI